MIIDIISILVFFYRDEGNSNGEVTNRSPCKSATKFVWKEDA
jgi:hypothetical protein